MQQVMKDATTTPHQPSVSCCTCLAHWDASGVSAVAIGGSAEEANELYLPLISLMEKRARRRCPPIATT
jgi:hypothetical protein